MKTPDSQGGGRQRVALYDGRVNNKGNPGNKGGRPPGSHSRISMAAREAAMRTGALPHELLLGWGRGEPMSRKVCKPGDDPNDPSTWHIEYLPVDGETMKDSAKAAAPYFAPKMSTVELLSGVSDDDLNELLKGAAAEAGIDLAALGASTPKPDQEAEDRTAGGSGEPDA